MMAWYALYHVARLQRGEKVLIHAAAGSTEELAVKIAKYLGAEVYVTVGSEVKKRLIIQRDGLNMPDSRIFYSQNTSFSKAIMRVTGGYGVDVHSRCTKYRSSFVNAYQRGRFSATTIPLAGVLTLRSTRIARITTRDVLDRMSARAMAAAGRCAVC